jgi:menaquinone-specific isochorismate synthase
MLGCGTVSTPTYAGRMTTAEGTHAPVVTTVAVPDPGALLDGLPVPGALAWVREGDGLVGWGEAARAEFRGPGRFRQAQAWWQRYLAAVAVVDEVGVPGSGPVAFGSFAFDDAGASVLVVPQHVVGRRDGRSWRTTIGPAPSITAMEPVTAPRGLRYRTALHAPAGWRAAVADAVRRIHAGQLGKVVLAKAVDAQAETPVDPRWLLARLADRYGDCWTFAVDGLVGATPELLVRRLGTEVRSRVLAGTITRGDDAQEDHLLAQALATSSKDLDEHRFAVDSVTASLRECCSEVTASAPYLLPLANVQHLATDVRGRVADEASALDLVAALHPTAAVAGTPTRDALAVIAELEDVDRGRYAGPVGWLDAAGDGEWGIALRCAALDGDRLRLYAGCGIVGESDPEAEAAEWEAKLLPIRQALTV